MAMIRDPEPLIHPHDHISQHDHNLDPEIEDIEACLALIPGRILARSRPTRIVDAHAKGGAQAEQPRRDEENADLMPPPARPEFLRPFLGAGQDEDGDQHDGDGEERDDRVEGLPVQRDGAIDVFGVRVQGIKRLDDGDDEHDQRHHYEHIDPDEGVMRDAMPPQVRMTRAEYALREDDVDDEDQHHPRGDEDLRGDGHGDVGRVARPGDAHDLRDDAGHAEAEEHAGHDEFVAATPVRLEDEHVRDGAAEEEEEEDGADGDVDGFGGEAAQAGGFGWVRGAGRFGHGGGGRGVLMVGEKVLVTTLMNGGGRWE